jgi:hypothetical protein
MRLDIDSAPTAIVKPLRHIQIDGVGSTHVNVKALRAIAKNAMKHHVFEILRVADHAFDDTLTAGKRPSGSCCTVGDDANKGRIKKQANLQT